ncbi:MAG: metalloregulator ArsR/SmtB family transcription factor [Pseudomonadota bacterium]
MKNTDLCTTFAALSDPIRLSIVERLGESGELSVSQIAEPYPVSLPAISRHLGVLEQAGLVERRVDRKWRKFRLRPDAVNSARDWFERNRIFWEASIDRLAELLNEASQEGPPAARQNDASPNSHSDDTSWEEEPDR